ncbi:MAG: hypothetical protein PHE29_00675 [Tissierellia bacterium]|nr:hypothetical protein [Tissierellia bacterium]
MVNKSAVSVFFILPIIKHNKNANNRKNKTEKVNPLPVNPITITVNISVIIPENIIL